MRLRPRKKVHQCNVQNSFGMYLQQRCRSLRSHHAHPTGAAHNASKSRTGNQGYPLAASATHAGNQGCKLTFSSLGTPERDPFSLQSLAKRGLRHSRSVLRLDGVNDLSRASVVEFLPGLVFNCAGVILKPFDMAPQTAVLLLQQLRLFAEPALFLALLLVRCQPVVAKNNTIAHGER